MIKVAKFGGSSVAGASQFQKVKAIVQSDSNRRVVVASAAGKRDSEDHKLTDLLYLCHAHLTYGVSCDEILRAIQERFAEIRSQLGLRYDVEGEFAALRASLTRDTPVDFLVSRGEYFTSRLLAEYLDYTFLDAADCVFFRMDGRFDLEKTYQAIGAAVQNSRGLVIPGFYGSLPTGRVKVMTRGGSDISGALAAAAVDAAVYENWTDVSGILMADPKIVENPSPIRRITYGELRELAFMGASVLHEESVQPVKDKGIPLNIRNTNQPDDPGTIITNQPDPQETRSDRFLTGIAGRRNFTILTVRRHNMNASAMLRQTLELFEQYRATVEHITLGLDSFALVTASTALGDRLFDLVAELQKTLSPDDVQIQDSLALVAVVGRKMAYRAGTSGKIFQALGDAGISVRTIAQAADEISIIVGVDNNNFEAAVRVLYDGFAG